MGELERLVERIQRALRTEFPEPAGYKPGKVSVWTKLVRLEQPGAEETLHGQVKQTVLSAGSYGELLYKVAETLVISVYGAEVSLVQDLPNLIVKLLDRKRTLPVDGAPPLDRADQLFLKVTVYRYEPSLWERLFPGKKESKGE